MLSMSISYVGHGRTKQKERTRAAMIDAARELMAEGTTPTVENAAARAQVSRATAYRYFTNQRELITATYPMIDMSSLLPDDPPGDPVERVVMVAERIMELIREFEPELTMSLRLWLEAGGSGSSEADIPLRKARRLAWFEDALRPLRGQLRPALLRRVALALASSVGVETFVWLTGMVGVSRKDAAEQLVWTARALVESVIPARERSAVRQRADHR